MTFLADQTYPYSVPFVRFEPELYRIIRSGTGRVIPPLYLPKLSNDLNDVLDLPRIQGFGHHVQHVLLQKRSAREVASILKCCPNVWNLALWLIQGTCMPLVPTLEKMPLRVFSFDPSSFFAQHSTDHGIPFNQPMFLNITHLKIINSTSLWSKWQQLALLPHLTHLALARTPHDFETWVSDQKFIARVLEECPNLQLLIVFLNDTGYVSPSGIPFNSTEDSRVVVLESVKNLLDQWEEGARSGEPEDFWRIAQNQQERNIRARKRIGGNLDNEAAATPSDHVSTILDI